MLQESRVNYVLTVISPAIKLLSVFVNDSASRGFRTSWSPLEYHQVLDYIVMAVSLQSLVTQMHTLPVSDTHTVVKRTNPMPLPVFAASNFILV